jgi:FtsP/CotA-like multicopper oxidase with cupredoxin domain
MPRIDRPWRNPRPQLPVSRRGFLRAGLAAGGALALTPPARAADPAPAPATAYVPRPGTTQYRFQVAPTTLDPDGKKAVPGITVNGTYPGPLIRAREGEMLRIEVENVLPDQPTTIHWHGLLLPAGMDGVPQVSNFPIAPQRVYVYEYPLRQSGTYWYHSHQGLQEQVGLAGPFVIEPRDEPLRVDHDAIVMLGDWLHRSPDAVFAALRKGGGGPTKKKEPTAKTPAQPGTGMAMGGGAKVDLADVDYDAFLLNGRGTQDPWTLAAKPGERIRLRLINGGASTYFRLRLDGHPLRITHADGLAVEPVTVDHLLVGMAEIYDAVVTLAQPGSYTLHAVAQDGSGQAIGVLHTPDVTPKPNLALPSFDGRALAYADLRAVAPTTLAPGPERAFTINLQGDMARYVWMLNGQVYPKTDPLLIRQGDRVSIALVNQTMMWHPMHLHGHFFRVLQGAGERAPLKHTVNVAPGETVRIEFAADNPGRWIFHCHNLYHLDAGMARVFEYEG